MLPQSQRQFFRDRGFRGKMDIDNFCIELSQGEHEATHGAGNWRLAKNVSDRYDFKLKEARAYASWISALFDEDADAADVAYENLLALPIPRGWLPSGPDDPLLLRAFVGVEFPSDVRTGPRP